jgi:hypothetical protein
MKKDTRDQARQTVHDVADTLSDFIDGLSDGTRAVIQSPEVEGAIDGVGRMLSGWASKLREGRETETETDEPESGVVLEAEVNVVETEDEPEKPTKSL